MVPIVGREIGKDVAELFGLDPKETRSIDIQIRPNDVVILKAEVFVTKGQMETIIHLVREYRLELIEEKSDD